MNETTKAPAAERVEQAAATDPIVPPSPEPPRKDEPQEAIPDDALPKVHSDTTE